MTGTPSALHPTQPKSKLVFHSQKLWGLLFLALESWAGLLGVRLGPLAPQEGPLQLKYPFQL